MGKVRIEAMRPELHAASGQRLNLFALRQRGPPDLPERSGAYHLSSITLNACGSLRQNSFVPAGAGIVIRENMAGGRCGPEHVEVMDLAQHVLHFFEVVAPGFVFGRQEVLDDVAKALDADA